jgi:IS30 family transposase
MTKTVPKKKGGARRGAGRPRQPIDLEKLEKLCRVHCSDQEIADYFGVSLSTIGRLKVREPYDKIFTGGKARGKVALRSARFDAALKGNPQLLIYLSKTHLGEREEIDINQSVAGTVSGRIEVTYVQQGKSEDDQGE